MTKKDTLKSIIREAIEEVKHDYDERQEIMLMKQIQSAAHWLVAHPEAEAKDVQHAATLIKGRIDELLGMHKNVQQEVAPAGWEGTVKAMKKHKDIDNPWALAHWMKGKGMKSHK